MNTIPEICLIVDTIRSWIIVLGYLSKSTQWVRYYYATMPKWDKIHIAKAFQVSSDKNSKCTIIVVTNAYGIGIDNLDMRLVVQWDLILSFDSIIPRMSRAARKKGQATFVLLIPK